MKYLATLILVLFAINAYPQILKPKQFSYCEIVGTGRLFSKKVSIAIDFGQEVGYFEKAYMKDENGDIMKFNSMIDALNFMGDQGWEFVQAYAVTYSNNSNVYHYLLKQALNESKLLELFDKKESN